MTAFEELVKDYKEQFLPYGKVELLSLKDLRGNPLYLQLFANTEPSGIMIEKEQSICYLSKVTSRVYLELEADGDQANVGLLKNLSKKIMADLRNSAIILNKEQ